MPRTPSLLPLLLLASAACYAPPVRLPLPVPFSPIGGATPVPGNGVGASLERAGTIRGPELARGEVMGWGLGVGAGDRIGIWLSNPQTQDQVLETTAHTDVQQIRAKAVLARPLGRRAAFALYVGHAFGNRLVVEEDYVYEPNALPVLVRDTLQNDAVWSWELAAPAEVLLSDPAAGARASIFLGPRVVFMQHDDRVRPDGTFRLTMAGALGGLHISVDRYEFFLEATLAYLPRRAYNSATAGGRVSVMPAVGLIVRVGPPFGW